MITRSAMLTHAIDHVPSLTPHEGNGTVAARSAGEGACARLDPTKWIGIVLCAGLGTRLRPLTRYVPKAAAPMGNFPLAFHTIKALLDAGIGQVHCNTHYLAAFLEEEIARAVNAAGYPPESVRFWREEPILETGGGIARIAREIARERPEIGPRDVIAISGDIHGEMPLAAMLEEWNAKDLSTTALMCTREAEKGRSDVTWFAPGEARGVARGRVVGFGKDHEPAAGYLPRNFSGHQMIAHDLAISSPIVKKSSIDLFYRTALAKGNTIAHVEHPEAMRWYNVGTYEEYRACAQAIAPAGDSGRSGGGMGEGDQAPPTHCLVIAPAHENAREGALTFPGVPTVRLPVFPWPFARLRPGVLRTFPCTESGEGFASVLLSLLASSVPSGAGSTSGSSVLSDSSNSSKSASLGVPFSSSWSGSSRSPVVLRLEAPSSWELTHSLLVPLEVFEAVAPSSLRTLTGLYGTSETFFLLTPARWQ